MLIEDKKYKSDENGNLIPIEDPNETNKVATNIPSNNSENNSDKLFRYQDSTKSKTFVYQDGKGNDHNISQNSNEYIDDLSPTPSEKEAQQSLNSTSMYSQQSTPYINEQQTNSFNYPETYNYPSDIPQQFETQVHQPINVPPTYQQNTQPPLLLCIRSRTLLI